MRIAITDNKEEVSSSDGKRLYRKILLIESVKQAIGFKEYRVRYLAGIMFVS